jgi:hypothetical protein
MDTELWQVICSNIRVSEQRIGDVKAQASALLVGAERLAALMDRYGDGPVSNAIAEMRGLAARQMRAMVGLVPEGSYQSRAYVDSDGVVNEPLTIALTITRKGDGLTFDFTGSSLPCMGPMNSVRATTYSSVYLAMRHIFPDVPISAGAFEPLTITGIEGTFLDAHYPRPVSGCAAEVSQRIAEAVFAAMVQALPDRVTAAPAGTSHAGGFVNRIDGHAVAFRPQGELIRPAGEWAHIVYGFENLGGEAGFQKESAFSTDKFICTQRGFDVQRLEARGKVAPLRHGGHLDRFELVAQALKRSIGLVVSDCHSTRIDGGQIFDCGFSTGFAGLGNQGI